MKTFSVDAIETIATNIPGAEGIAVANDGRIFIGAEDGWVYAISPIGEVSQFAKTPGRPLGIAIDKLGNLLSVIGMRVEYIKSQQVEKSRFLLIQRVSTKCNSQTSACSMRRAIYMFSIREPHAEIHRSTTRMERYFAYRPPVNVSCLQRDFIKPMDLPYAEESPRCM